MQLLLHRMEGNFLFFQAKILFIIVVRRVYISAERLLSRCVRMSVRVYQLYNRETEFYEIWY
jgi:hypothetical protein